MLLSKYHRVFWTFLMSLMMSSLPHVAWAEAAQEMIPTANVVEALTRVQAEQKIQGYMNRADLRQALVDRGISPTEVSSRIASLSDMELRQLAQQMDQARYGGDPTGILVLVLLIVLIIFLVKRI